MVIHSLHILERNYPFRTSKIPRFHCWDNPKPARKRWAFGWLTGIDSDLICIFPNVKTRVIEHYALSPIHSNRIIALIAFIAKRFLFLVDHNLEGLEC